jgi:hypothetical protein
MCAVVSLSALFVQWEKGFQTFIFELCGIAGSPPTGGNTISKMPKSFFFITWALMSQLSSLNMSMFV